MPANKINQPVTSYSRGFITEASPLNFPEGASIEELNFRLDRDGTRMRRWPMENIGGVPLTPNISQQQLEKAAATAYRWDNPNGDDRISIGVIQIHRFLYFINLLKDYPTNWILNGGTPIEAPITGTTEISFTTINGYLIAYSEEIPQPYGFIYDYDSDVITSVTSPILVRDIWGVDDSLGDTDRPTELSPAHRYNLINQGWHENVKTTGTPGEHVIDYVFKNTGIYPSNSDQWGIGRINDLTDADVYLFDINIAIRNQVDFGLVPKGHFIIDIFNRGLSRHTLTGLTLPMDREETYFSTIETFAGRIWYSGCKGYKVGEDNYSPDMSSAVLFSQVMEKGLEVVRCYQKGDPTSYDFNEVVDSDGGFIQIQGASRIRRLFATKESIFVFAENGVWEIRGSREEGFTATSFQINKISNIGISSPKSVVNANGTIFYWAYSGIYAITPNPDAPGVYETINVTQMTIQTFYDDLTEFTKQHAKGIFDPYNNKLRWLYQSNGSGSEARINVATCNHNPAMLRSSDTSLTLTTRKAGIDWVALYGYVVNVDANNTLSLGNRYTIEFSANPDDLVAHNLGTYELDALDHYMLFVYKDVSGNVKARTLTRSLTSDNILIGNAVTVNSVCTNQWNEIGVAKLTTSKAIIAFRDTGSKLALQIVNSNLTYGTVVSSSTAASPNTNTSVVALTSTTGVACWLNGTSIRLAYYTVSGNVITLNADSTWPTGTQMPTGTTLCYDAKIALISSTKILVTCRLTNATLGYTNVLASFIVTISGSTLSSTTILLQPTLIGTNPSPVVMDTNNATITYEYTAASVDDNRIDYSYIDISGTTPIAVSNGIVDIATEFDVSHVHDSVLLHDNTIATAFRGIGSIGVGNEVVSVTEVA